MTRALLLDSKVPNFFWPEAVATSIYLLNRLPTIILNLKNPLQVLSTLSKVPLALSLEPRIFGCSVFVHIPKHERTKLSPCAVKCVFIGYGIHQKGYRCYDPKTRQVITTMNCTFLETEFFYDTQLTSQGERDKNEITSNDVISWLPMSNDHNPPTEGPQEPANTVAEHVLNTDQPVELSDPPTTSHPISEVNNLVENSVTVTTNNVIIEDEGINIIDEDTGQYIVPPRSTRGILPKRYTPKKSSRRSRYSAGNVAKENLTKMARAFVAALYEE